MRVILWALVAMACGGNGTAECEKLRPLNDVVRQGELSDGQRACLQRRLDDPNDSMRQAVSELLLFDARRRDDGGASWAARAETHVDAFPNDVVTLMRLANFHQRKGPQAAETSMNFARRGLSYLQRNPATTPAEKRAFHDLLKAKAIAAEMLASPESPKENKERTAQYARDWFTVATAMSLPTDRAIAMCLNTGAVEAYCDGSINELYGSTEGSASE